jgi:hypothetical protein
MKRYPICALAAVGLALNADAAAQNKEKGSVYSVPDSGSTALLLGTTVLALGVASPRFATR